MQERRLAAIMFTDIVGYTALMGKDEEQAFELLHKNRQLQRPLIGKYNGEWLKEMGDGILASFNSSSDAVRCAGEIQNLAGEEDISLRIGIHVGEVVFQGGDVLGDGVNVASRLEELADEGSINISGSVYRDIKNKAGIKAHFVAEKIMKNVEEPIAVYKVFCEEVQRAEKSKFSLTEDTKKSIAVLPFVNMSNDPEQEYFCDGMSEEIINALTHVESLKVIARTSAFMFKGKHEDMREIGKKLNVETLLEGSVRKAGNRLRITAQLIKASDGVHLWSEHFDRDIEDVFAIQDEISLAIVENLKVKLLGEQKAVLVRRHTENFKANLLYIKGRQSRQQKNLEGFNKALKYLEESIALDPEFALAYAEIALTYALMGWFCLILVNDKLKEKIIYFAEKAIKLDKYASDAYIALALTWELIDNDQVKAEEYAHKAINLNPGSSEAILEYGFILGRMGRYKAAMKKMESTLILDPLSIMANNGIGYMLFYQGHFKQAIKQMRYILEMDLAFFPARFMISLSLTEMEDYSEAMLELDKCPQTNPLVISHQGYIYAKLNKTKEAFNILEKIQNEFNKDPLFEFLIALIYIGLDDVNISFEWLKKSQDKYGFVYHDRTIGSDFRLKDIRKDPKFNDFILH